MKPRTDIRIRIPVDAVVTPEEMRAHSRIDFSDDDNILQNYIAAASDYITTIADRALCLEGRLSIYRGTDVHLWLGKPHVRSVTRVYVQDNKGNQMDISPDGYDLQDADAPWLAGYVWINPSVFPNNLHGDLRIEYDCGWSDAEDIPEMLRQAVRLLAGHYYEHREEGIPAVTINRLPLGVHALVEPWRWRGLP